MSDSIEGLVFGRSQLRREVLGYLFADTGREVHPSQLARVLGYTRQAVARELRHLERAGVVRSERVGRAERYRVDDRSPLMPELSGLVAKTIGVEGRLRSALDAVPGIDEAFIFGSYARGEAGAVSDIDLLVVGEPDQDLLTTRLAEAEQSVGREANVVTYTCGELEHRWAAGDAFVRDVLRGPRITLIPRADP